MTLNASAAPGANFDLDDWKIQLPVDASGGFAGPYAEVKDLHSFSNPYFFTGPDGAMVMRAPVEGVTTGGAKYARSELREMISGANAAWSLGQGGYMAVAMQVDEVPRNLDGTAAKIVIGQIHGGDHQLVRLYYDKGSIYWVNGRNEVQAKDVVHQFRDASGNTPKVSLDEGFAYTMDVKGDALTLTMCADGKLYTSSITIGPGWDDNSFYFKAGLYLGTNETNSTGDGQVSVFGIAVTHNGTRPVVGFPEDQAPSDPGSTDPATPTPSLVINGTDLSETFTVTKEGTVVNGGKGTDTVRSSVDFTLSPDTERLELTGTGDVDGVGSDVSNRLRGNDAANSLYGRGGDDQLSGRSGADHLDGGLGHDRLEGGSGNDRLEGGGGDDRLAGNGGLDILVGGEGSDVFVFSSLSHSRGTQVDQIVDFAGGTDDIDLSAIDANAKVSGNQAFVWDGNGIGHLIMKDGHLMADTNGDGVADLAIDLGGANLTSFDVLL